MMSRLSVLPLVGLLVLLTVGILPASAATTCSGTLLWLYTDPNPTTGGFVFTISNANTCTVGSTQCSAFVVSATGDYRRETYSTVLTAYTLGKSITINNPTIAPAGGTYCNFGTAVLYP